MTDVRFEAFIILQSSAKLSFCYGIAWCATKKRICTLFFQEEVVFVSSHVILLEKQGVCGIVF